MIVLRILIKSKMNFDNASVWKIVESNKEKLKADALNTLILSTSDQITEAIVIIFFIIFGTKRLIMVAIIGTTISKNR